MEALKVDKTMLMLDFKLQNHKVGLNVHFAMSSECKCKVNDAKTSALRERKYSHNFMFTRNCSYLDR